MNELIMCISPINFTSTELFLIDTKTGCHLEAQLIKYAVGYSLNV